MLPVCHEDTWPALNGRWSWKLCEGISHVIQGLWSMLAGLRLHWRLCGLPLFLCHLLFVTISRCVSGMNCLGLLIFVSPKEVCFLFKCMFWGQEDQIIGSCPTPNTIHFLPFNLPLKWSLFIQDRDKLKECKCQCVGERPREDGEGCGPGAARRNQKSPFVHCKNCKSS